MRINIFLKLEMNLFMTQKELQIYLMIFFIQSVKDLASHFSNVEVDRQYLVVDEDANQFENIEDNVKLFKI